MGTNPIRFREEVLKKFFYHVKSGESFYVVGVLSAGKPHLMDFFDVYDLNAIRRTCKKYYLGAELSAKTWLARVEYYSKKFKQGSKITK